MEIQLEQLSDEAIAGIIENFILREGTDYGSVEVSERKSEQIRQQIDCGDMKIVFVQDSETINSTDKSRIQIAHQFKGTKINFLTRLRSSSIQPGLRPRGSPRYPFVSNNPIKYYE
ncbi:MAG: YheU family protein [Bdellovibrionales bacterium]|nr:YheU family protein [Bdellovibrionales bacterium]